MHTAVSELMMVFERIIEYGCKYCCVCLRMENEKNLIVPKAFKAYILTLNNKNIDFTETTRVCIVCEEKAKAALRFLKAAQLAVSVQELYTDMLKEKSYRKEVQQHFNEINVKDHFRALDQVEEQLKSWRTHTELVFTEVLIVENVDTSDDNSVSPEKIFSTERKSKKLLIDETEEKVLDISEESECSKPAGDDTVIVLDDDEVIETNSNNDQNDNPSVSIYRCLKESRKRYKRTYTRSKININGSKLRIRNDLTDNTAIHPTKTLAGRNDPTNDIDDGPLLIDNPQLVQMLNNKKNHKDLNAISKVSPMKLDNATSLNIKNMYQTVPDIFIQPTICNSSGDLIFQDVANATDLNIAPSLSAPQLLIIPNSIVNIPHKRSVWPVRVTAGLPVKQDSPTQLAEITPLSDEKTPSIAPTAEARKCLTIQSGKFQGVEKDLVKEPVPKEVKIDWEDKIPMDVISFMESNNQPVPASQIVSDSSPVGGITDVRSIMDIMQDSDVPPIVDLCYLD